MHICIGVESYEFFLREREREEVNHERYNSFFFFFLVPVWELLISDSLFAYVRQKINKYIKTGLFQKIET